MGPLRITDTTLRDAHQSLWATRMEIGDIIPILPKMDSVGYWSIEAWGGATFDVCLRFMDENPWERLRTIKKHCPKTPLQMLLRGQNLVGYHHYSDEIVDRFVKASQRNGIHVFRVFDALNDIRNVEASARSIKDAGGHFEGAISYTVSPVHTIDSYIEYAQQLKELGADTICIKDMAGMLTPYRTERMVNALGKEVGLPVHVHCHYIGGMAPMNYLKASEAGAAIVDTATVALAFGNSQPAGEMIVAALQESSRDTGLDLETLFEIASYWEDVRERKHLKRGVTSLLQMEVFSHQVPGGMMSNLISQLELQHAVDRVPDVLKEIPRVRAEVGYPPLVTPLSQIVGTQAVLNVLTGKRWSIISGEMKDYIRGLYGKAPGPMEKEIVELVMRDEEPLDPTIRPGSLVTTTYAEIEEEIGDLARTEEDVLMYALFPKEAREYLERHRDTGAENTVFMSMGEYSESKEDDAVDVTQIRELIKALEESNVDEITIEEDGGRISLRKGGAAPAYVAPGPSTFPDSAPLPVGGAGGGHAAAKGDHLPASASVAKAHPDTWVAITSPMVGTFYSAPSPNDPDFVKVGDVVEADATFCIVEAMKLMNEITADTKCEVKEICVSNEDPVEFGTALLYVEPVA